MATATPARRAQGQRRSAGFGEAEPTALDAALRASRGALIHLVVLGAMITALGFGTALYTLEIFGRIMSTRSMPTLIGITVPFLLASILYVTLLALRSAALRRIGLAIDAGVSAPAYDAVYASALETRRLDRLGAMQDLDTVRRFWSSTSLTSLLDLPFFPVYVIVCFGFHVVLGLAMMAALAVVLLLALAGELGNRGLLRHGADETRTEKDLLTGALREAEAIHALGMIGRTRERWLAHGRRALAWSVASSGFAHNLGYVAAFWQSFVQFGMVALAAYLTLQGQVSPAAMFAVMFIGAGGVGVVRGASSQWPLFIAARQAHARLQHLLRSGPDAAMRLVLPRPTGELDVTGLAMTAPGAPRLILREVSFNLPAGATLAVIGPSGAGKSTLVRALTGVWRPALGTVRLDGAELQHWDPDELGRHLGYLPQDVELLAGTIGENIARFRPADDEDIRRAAELAGAADLIAALPGGYDTPVGQDGGALSGGQRQRIGLARALFGDPALVILDEPNANLDTDGEEALAEAIRALKARGTTCLIITHKANILNLVDHVLVLKDGSVARFGPTAEVAAAGPRPVSRQAIGA